MLFENICAPRLFVSVYRRIRSNGISGMRALFRQKVIGGNTQGLRNDL